MLCVCTRFSVKQDEKSDECEAFHSKQANGHTHNSNRFCRTSLLRPAIAIDKILQIHWNGEITGQWGTDRGAIFGRARAMCHNWHGVGGGMRQHTSHRHHRIQLEADSNRFDGMHACVTPRYPKQISGIPLEARRIRRSTCLCALKSIHLRVCVRVSQMAKCNVHFCSRLNRAHSHSHLYSCHKSWAVISLHSQRTRAKIKWTVRDSCDVHSFAFTYTSDCTLAAFHDWPKQLARQAA